ncbi:MAG: hypothetical protein ABI634_18310 [Acidobacteriota bacterium]
MITPNLHATLMAAATPAGQVAADAPVLTVAEVVQILSGQMVLQADGRLVVDTSKGKK